MLQLIAPNIWHIQHAFTSNGLPVSSRMTVIRLSNGNLWLHSPVALSSTLKAELDALGKVEFIVAPNKYHHLFVGDYLHAYPAARLYGAPGLSKKRPDLKGMQELSPHIEPEWQTDLEQIFFAGIPVGNETVWFHRASGTLILTDLCQWWQGDLSFSAAMYASLTGVRKQLAVPKTIRWMTKDKPAARDCANKILAWPIERIVVAHNAIIEKNARASLQQALSWFEH
ncbi:DUF4336 domain-containing protein [Undibacterium jejuense]|uniref:DUF4336 domain-containing protein n=1 Tax=Undibacterium jejuense TaxID=1344949 RepID=A0A923HJ00_9BURK|nr:DUF4336 domain-containing protein [Undibacterium jejuense]MBC3863060.1 DUF4336 domain-containing protein [Undibacterium jejuense]